MVSKYKISDKAILTDSDGTRDMIVDGTVYYNDSDGKTLTITNTIRSLSPDYFTDYFALPPYTFQGSTSGYTSGGSTPSGRSNVIDKFPFSSDANATDVGDLLLDISGVAGQSSNTHGYTSGGSPSKDIIQKFSFSVDGNATDVGDLTIIREGATGQSSSENGYTSGGFDETFSNPPYQRDEIDKFPFSTDANATDVGNLTETRGAVAGQSSASNGYTSGGILGSFAYTNVIDKFPFSTDANATDVGDLTQQRQYSAGQSSSTHGYTDGGYPPDNLNTDIIDKFSFASDGNATDVGNMLSGGNKDMAGQSSTANGYISGGTLSNVIQKFPFSADANATDVGDLTVARGESAEQQV